MVTLLFTHFSADILPSAIGFSLCPGSYIIFDEEFIFILTLLTNIPDITICHIKFLVML